MRCPILIGRPSRAALIADAVRGLSRGRGAAIVVTGEAGIGKTRLAEHIRVAAADARLPSVTGRALPDPLGSALRPVAELILAVTRDRPPPADAELAPYVQVLAALVPHWREPGWSAPAEHILVTAEAVLRILRWATDGAGVVAILEDLHWADAATLAVTRYLVDHASEIPVVILASVRTGEGRDDVTEVLRAGGAQVRLLGRLLDDESRDMARACAGPGPAGDDAWRRHRRRGPCRRGPAAPGRGPAGGWRPGRAAAAIRCHRESAAGPARRTAAAGARRGGRAGPFFDWRLLAPATGVSADIVTATLHRGQRCS